LKRAGEDFENLIEATCKLAQLEIARHGQRDLSRSYDWFDCIGAAGRAFLPTLTSVAVSRIISQLSREDAMSDREMEAAATGGFVRNKRDLARQAQGRVINQKLQELGWTQADLCRATGLPRYTVSRAVRGENVLSEDVLDKIASALKIKPDDIVRKAERSTLDDLPRGVHNTHMINGDIWLRVNGPVKPGVHLAIEALFYHDRPITKQQLSHIINIVDPPDRSTLGLASEEEPVEIA
jgi:transcriptional regulator with XRE-family HTH domain